MFGLYTETITLSHSLFIPSSSTSGLVGEVDEEKRLSGVSHIDATVHRPRDDESASSSKLRFPTSVHMSRRRLLLSAAFLSYLLHGMAIVSVVASGGVEVRGNLDLTKTTTLSTSSHRKMLLLSPGKKAETRAETRAEPDRIGEKCKRSDIVVNQAATEPMPNGIPGYTVEITNQCMSGCKISRIHVSCGWFSSAKLINPRVFKRIHYDDCLVNNGKPLPYGSTLSFHYANTFPYPLSVSFVTCS